MFVNADDVGETIIDCAGADVDDDVDDDVQSSGDEAEFKAVISPRQSELKQEAMDTSSPSFHRPGSPSYTPAISDWSEPEGAQQIVSASGSGAKASSLKATETATNVRKVAEASAAAAMCQRRYSHTPVYSGRHRASGGGNEAATSATPMSSPKETASATAEVIGASGGQAAAGSSGTPSNAADNIVVIPSVASAGPMPAQASVSTNIKPRQPLSISATSGESARVIVSKDAKATLDFLFKRKSSS